MMCSLAGMDIAFYGIERNIMMDGAMVEEASVPSAIAGEGGDVSKEEITIRGKVLWKTALWVPYIILENGKKEIIWHIPDTLTTWNIIVVANEDIAVGMGSSKCTCNQRCKLEE